MTKPHYMHSIGVHIIKVCKANNQGCKHVSQLIKIDKLLQLRHLLL